MIDSTHGVHPTLVDLLEPVDGLHHYEHNARTHADAVLRESLVENGQYRPIVARRADRQVLAGNGTLAAARELGWSHVAVTWVDVDETRARKIAAVDNRANDLAGYDDAALAELLRPLELDLAGTGYSPDDIDALVAKAAGAGPLGGTNPDDVPEPPAAPRTRPDDLWILGEHRLLCADATRRDSYRALLGDERPALLLTDPPYGVSHGAGATEAKAIRGDLSQAVIPVSFACALEFVDPNARIYLFGGSGQFAMYLGLWDHHLVALPRLIIWDKTHFVLRPNGYHSQFECVFYGWKGNGGAASHWYGDRKATDVWAIPRDPQNERVHSTQKPVALLEIPVTYSAPPGGLVLDPFGGSGSTLIAAHRLGRRARLLEIDPVHCDTIARRWQEYTGETPVLEATGEPVDFARPPA